MFSRTVSRCAAAIRFGIPSQRTAQTTALTVHLITIPGLSPLCSDRRSQSFSSSAAMAAQNSATPPEQTLENYTSVFKPDILKGKVAFITGGGSGIGFTIAEVLMRHGCDVAIASRNLEKCKNAKAILEAAVPGRKCFATAMDIRKADDVSAAVKSIMSEYGQLNILVNNAAGNFLCPADSLSPNAFKNVIDIDTNGTFNATKAVYDLAFKNGNGGVVVNLTATLHQNAQVLQVHAGSAKAAIEAMTKHLAVEWGPQNIRLVCVAPGPIKDTVGYSKLGGAAISEEMIASMIPLNRVGERVDIANTVLFVASDAASFITGTTIVADGGAVYTAVNGAKIKHLFGANM